MMTACRVVLRSCFWIVVVALSVGTWWYVNDRLEPKPAWTIPVDDTLRLTHYQSEQRLLTGYRPRADQQMELVVLDATTGVERATLAVSSQPALILDSYQNIHRSPRLFGDAVMRFADVKRATGEHEVQLRS